eukprot:6201220-Pleurochrysis_carterae.AAC.5
MRVLVLQYFSIRPTHCHRITRAPRSSSVRSKVTAPPGMWQIKEPMRRDSAYCRPHELRARQHRQSAVRGCCPCLAHWPAAHARKRSAQTCRPGDRHSEKLVTQQPRATIQSIFRNKAVSIQKQETRIDEIGR